MTIQKIAIPSQAPGGLDCKRSEHFGHCSIFTIVTLDGNAVTNVSTIENVEHGTEGCNEPVSLLQQHDVNSLVVQGIGQRPLVGFQEAGIDVLFSPLISKPTVQEVIEDFQNNTLQSINVDQACKGHGNCHDH